MRSWHWCMLLLESSRSLPRVSRVLGGDGQGRSQADPLPQRSWDYQAESPALTLSADLPRGLWKMPSDAMRVPLMLGSPLLSALFLQGLCPTNFLVPGFLRQQPLAGGSVPNSQVVSGSPGTGYGREQPMRSAHRPRPPSSKQEAGGSSALSP